MRRAASLPGNVELPDDLADVVSCALLLDHPELRGRPVVVGGGRRHAPVRDEHGAWRFSQLSEYTGRGVITTSTYEARALGVFSGMPTMKAAARAPHAVLLPVDFDSYRRYSRLFKAAVREIAPVIEDRGIDEIYIDLTDVIGARLGPDVDPLEAHAEAWWCAREIGRELKQAVKDATGLSCSVGLAPNKLVAKIASELDKPDGLTLITEHDVATRLSPLSVRRLNGVGPKSAAKLARLGIATIGELAESDPASAGVVCIVEPRQGGELGRGSGLADLAKFFPLRRREIFKTLREGDPLEAERPGLRDHRLRQRFAV